jgi:ketosteroid isomerase-like protein
MSRENVEVVRKSYEPPQGGLKLDQIENWLTDAVVNEYFDPDLEWIPISDGLLTGESYRGYEGLRRFWSDLLGACDELVIEPLEFRAAADQVVVVQRMNIRARGIEIDEVWSRLYTLNEGRIVRVQTFTNRDAALKAAGLSE